MFYYAKIVPHNHGLRRFKVEIYLTDGMIDSPWATKRFFSFQKATKWAEGTIRYLGFIREKRSFVREADVIRSKF